MNSMDSAISTAIRIEGLRQKQKMEDLAASAGIPCTTFFDRLCGRRSWNTEELAKVSKALNLNSMWELLDLAKDEQRLADSRMGVAA